MSVTPSLPLSSFVPISVSLSAVGVPGPSFSQGCIIGSSSVIPTVGSNPRVRLYTGTSAMLQDGFATTSPEFIAASMYFGQEPAPTYLWVGRQNLTAINTVTVGASGGSLYTIGDFLNVIQSGASGGQVQVTTTGSTLAATTTGNAAFGVTVIAVASAVGIADGQTVTGAGIPGATTVSSISGLNITISAATTANLSATPLTFSLASHATASSGSNGLAVTTGDGAHIAVGDTVTGAGIPLGTTVTVVATDNITISQLTTQALSTTAVTFSVVTNATAAAGTTTMTVGVGTGIVIGQVIAGTGIALGTTVTNVVSTTVTMSAPNIATLSTTAVTFTTVGVVTGVQLVPSAQGSGYTVANNLSTTGGTGSGAQIDVTVIGETPLEAVAACRTIQPAWYACMFVGTATDSDYEAIATYIEGATPASIFFLTSGELAILNNSPNNLFATLQALNYRRTFMMYSTTQSGAFPNNIYATASVMGAAMGLNNGSAGSYFTIMFKAIAGIGPEPLTQTQVTTIAGTNQRSSTGLNGNIFVVYANGAYETVQNGTMAGGLFLDIIIFTDMLVSDCQYSAANLLFSLPSVPITNAGVSAMSNVLGGACSRSQNLGFIAPAGVWTGPSIGGNAANGIKTGDSLPSGYYIYAPSVTTLSPAAKAARQLPPFTILVITSEAAQTLSVAIDVQL